MSNMQKHTTPMSLVEFMFDIVRISMRIDQGVTDAVAKWHGNSYVVSSVMADLVLKCNTDGVITATCSGGEQTTNIQDVESPQDIIDWMIEQGIF